MEKYQGAEAFVEVLNRYGVADIFFNPGGEQAAIQATIAKRRVLGQRAPRLILCLDESVALTAAHGHYVVSGKPQVVMVHSELGTLQVGGALHNAQWGRVPLILWAGLAAAPQRVNWKQEPYDQAMMVRNCVKWDHQIRPDENLQEVLQEAFKIAMTEPRGPVYLCYPRDALTKSVDKLPVPRLSDTPLPAVKADAVARIAEELVAAKNP